MLQPSVQKLRDDYFKDATVTLPTVVILARVTMQYS